MKLNLKTTGLVLEGGGMRGVFTSGVLDAFMKHDVQTVCYDLYFLQNLSLRNRCFEALILNLYYAHSLFYNNIFCKITKKT